MLITFMMGYGKIRERVNGVGTRTFEVPARHFSNLDHSLNSDMSLYGGIKLAGSKLPTASTSTTSSSTPAEVKAPTVAVDQDKPRRTASPLPLLVPRCSSEAYIVAH